jgi:hypothetical protein
MSSMADLIKEYGLYFHDRSIPLFPVVSSAGVAFCPYCNKSLWQNKDESHFCFRCGQAIKWKDEK